ncbi:Mu transposase C-terminal domain-containing protein [Burkholderia gladioli]|uniref:Mu transposase C-terminal domain-containing protein n=1 Tax=Burkholderia gladioli TaxID=28095 RepID=UPI00164069F5|nr:Mu transposase C-terminal domain-containing protein [Burkholderia gladioli]
MNTLTQMAFIPGTEVLFLGRPHRIAQAVDFDEVLLRDLETKQLVHAKLADLQAAQPMPAIPRPDLLSVAESDWSEAERRHAIILPLLGQRRRKRDDVVGRAAEFGLHANTLYTWLRAYESSGLMTALLPKQQRKDKGATKLQAEIEAIIEDVIKTEYLTTQKKSKEWICNEVRRRCSAAGIAPPHANTVRNRLTTLPAELTVAKRQGRKAAEQAYSPVEGSFPGADAPLAVVQIDHTKLDIVLVDDVHRRAIGRPWITLAIDVHSRMVAGFYVSFDPPGALSTGLCLAHAILPKDQWLAKRGIDGTWPCYGLPRKLHMDNAREFRGQMLERACRQYGIDIEWRPVARPHFGAHIERLLGTLSTEIKTLPGTTFSNVKERGDYDSVGKAALTLSEFEEWLTTYVVKVYHLRMHSGIGMPPMAMYRKGIFGDERQPGIGLPARIQDEDRLRLDLMPFEERTVQDYGVLIDEIHYYSDVLRRWINAPDPQKPKYKRKFMFRRDPRDISAIWFYDPELGQYFAIPYRDTSHPPISVWELREAKKALEEQGRLHVDERAIFDAYERMREIERAAQANTTAARRAQQRRKLGLAAPKPRGSDMPPIALADDVPLANPPSIMPFDELDDMA